MRRQTLLIIISFLLLFPSTGTFAEDNCCTYESPGNPYLCYETGNCTWWAWYKRPDLPAWVGDASTWLTNAQISNIPTGTSPVVGSIACFPDMAGGLGHVAFVESVNSDNSFFVSEMGYQTWNCLHTQTYQSGSAAGFVYGGPAGNVYACSWQSQIPGGVVNLSPDQSFSFSVSYKNTGNTIWSNTGGLANPDYVELRSCNPSGNLTPSWLFPGPEQGWIDAERVGPANADSIANGQVAVFNFTGTVPASATSGLYEIFFRPYHATAGYIENWGGMHFRVNVVNWLVSPLPSSPGNGNGPYASGYWWYNPGFDESNWVPANLPLNNNFNCDNCSRYLRSWYYVSNLEQTLKVSFDVDNSLRLYVNGLLVGEWGFATGNCINNVPWTCSGHLTIPPVDITPYLQIGNNLIAAEAYDATGWEYANIQLADEPMSSELSGVCCVNNNCIQLSSDYTAADCISAGGYLHTGKQYDCSEFSPCANQNDQVIGDPTLTYKTATPLPALPDTLTFQLVDTMPLLTWYALPSSLGGETLYVTDFSGQFSVLAKTSANPDTVTLKVVDYAFQAPSVLIGTVPSGENTVTLDTSVIVNQHGTYCRSTKLVDMVIPLILTNDLFPPANPVRSRSFVRGNLNETSGILTTASASINLLPTCCLRPGDANNDNRVTILDAVFIISFLYKGGEAPICDDQADANADCRLTILDAVYLIGYLYKDGTSPNCGCVD